VPERSLRSGSLCAEAGQGVLPFPAPARSSRLRMRRVTSASTAQTGLGRVTQVTEPNGALQVNPNSFEAHGGGPVGRAKPLIRFTHFDATT
jgi:hypothetical protein